MNLFLVFVPVFVWFMCTIDIPMYIGQAKEDMINGRVYLGVFEGGLRGMKCDVIDQRWSVWWEEALWQTPYFTLCVLSSLGMAWGSRYFEPKVLVLGVKQE